MPYFERKINEQGVILDYNISFKPDVYEVVYKIIAVKKWKEKFGGKFYVIFILSLHEGGKILKLMIYHELVDIFA